MSPTIPPDHASGDAADWDAIARYLAGESAAAEAESMKRWLDVNPAEASLLATFDGVLEKELAGDIASDRAPLDVESALTRVRERMAAESAAGVRDIATARTRRQVAERPTQTRSFWRIGGLAAAAVLVIAFGAQRWRAKAPTSGTAVATTYATPVGARQSVNLPDGSVVNLAPGSRMTVLAGFGSTERIVVLDGAAYFTVVHDSERPFAVQAGSAVIRDIGTAFSVKTMADSSVLVAVREGAVALSGSGSSSRAVELRAGDRAAVRADARIVAERGATTPGDAAWSADSLVFRDATWAEVQADLRRWYGVQLVVVDSSLLNRTVTNTSVATDSGVHVAQVIASMMGAELQHRGDTALLVKPRARQRP